jgi:hypothetical protein
MGYVKYKKGEGQRRVSKWMKIKEEKKEKAVSMR